MSGAKRLLLIAFHCPPIQGSTGVTRTLSFAKYLRDFGWEVTLLSASPRAYPEVRMENLAQIPPHVRVERALAFDTKRHLSIFGRYPWWMASPDRWRSWYGPAVRKAAHIVKNWRPSVVMSTYPIATAHQIGAEVARRFNLPWIADMRDPMAQDGYPEDPRIHRAFVRIEEAIFARASNVLVTTSGAAETYAKRFIAYPRERLALIPNGFDAEMFPSQLPAQTARDKAPITLLHSGVLYPSERDPTLFFRAVSELRSEGVLKPEDVQFNFRATGHDALYAPQLAELNLQGLVNLLPPVPYAQALAEMTAADAFMLFQASNCNDQIPAKVYEYLYAGKPILGLTDAAGETARTMLSVGSNAIANLHDKDSIKARLPEFLRQVRSSSAPVPSRAQVEQFSRRNLTGKLAGLLDALI